MPLADAAARDIADGDVVRVFNDRGACLVGLVLSDAVRQGVVHIATGAWFDPVSPGDPATLERHGNPNVLTIDTGTSRLAQGPSALTALVEVERATEDLRPPVEAIDPPTVERRGWLRRPRSDTDVERRGGSHRQRARHRRLQSRRNRLSGARPSYVRELTCVLGHEALSTAARLGQGPLPVLKEQHALFEHAPRFVAVHEVFDHPSLALHDPHAAPARTEVPLRRGALALGSQHSPVLVGFGTELQGLPLSTGERHLPRDDQSTVHDEDLLRRRTRRCGTPFALVIDVGPPTGYDNQPGCRGCIPTR